MRKIIVACCVMFSITLVGCAKAANTDHVVMSNGESMKFTTEEITNAMEHVKDNFDFKDCTLTKLAYDEEVSNNAVKNYKQHGEGMYNDIKEENIITILSEFEVGARAQSSLGKNTTKTGYTWTMIRDNKEANWKLEENGY